MRKTIATLAVIAFAGEWVTTPDGRRVCQLAETIQHASILTPDFCMSWQEPFRRRSRGETLPFGEGWIRRRDLYGFWGTLQIHVEGRGWVP